MIIEVKAKTGSKMEVIHKTFENKYVVCLKEKPEDNKANKELLKVLKKHFNCEVRFLKGLKSRNKLLEVICP